MSDRVLVVDDDEAIRTLLSAVLKRKGFAVETVRNGKDAIQKIRTTEYAAILLDLMMPEVDGYDVIAHLERTAPDVLCDCVIVVSAVSTKDLERLEGKSILRIIRKPFDLDELTATVVACTDARRAELSS